MAPKPSYGWACFQHPKHCMDIMPICLCVLFPMSLCAWWRENHDIRTGWKIDGNKHGRMCGGTASSHRRPHVWHEGREENDRLTNPNPKHFEETNRQPEEQAPKQTVCVTIITSRHYENLPQPITCGQPPTNWDFPGHSWSQMPTMPKLFWSLWGGPTQSLARDSSDNENHPTIIINQRHGHDDNQGHFISLITYVVEGLHDM